MGNEHELVEDVDAQALIKLVKFIMYQSIPSLTIHPPGDPGDSHVFTPRGVGFSPTFLCLGSGF